MRFLPWIIAGLAVIEAGWMTFDGTRALLVGDYITPSSGEYAGQLGPWSNVVAAVGLDPRSTLMKSVFAIYGIVWLAMTVAFLRNASWAWTAMLIAAAGALWYLPIGTALGVLQIVLLIVLGQTTAG